MIWGRGHMRGKGQNYGGAAVKICQLQPGLSYTGEGDISKFLVIQ